MKTYNEQTMKAHAIAYERHKDRLNEISPDDIDRLKRENKRNFNQIAETLEIWFVDGQPYGSTEQMSEEVKETGVLMISRDHNDSNLFDKQENLEFRAVHDWFHIATGQPFGYVGECLTYESQKMWYSNDLHWILFSEICLQAAYHD